MRHTVVFLIFHFVLVMLVACDNLSDFSTAEGSCYIGDIIDADFVRSGSFEAGVRLTMSLDVDTLARGDRNGAVISTSDGLFDGAPVRQMLEVTRDSLSKLDFPGGRVRSYLAFAPDTSGQVANVVISLMETDDVEVRIFRPSVSSDDSLFGVFRLTRNDFCNAPEVKENLQDASVVGEE